MIAKFAQGMTRSHAMPSYPIKNPAPLTPLTLQRPRVWNQPVLLCHAGQDILVIEDRRERHPCRFSIHDMLSACPFHILYIPSRKAQSIVIRLETGPWPGLRSGNSVIWSDFSSSAPIFRFITCCFNPLSKLLMQTQALIIVEITRIMVIIVKLVNVFRTDS